MSNIQLKYCHSICSVRVTTASVCWLIAVTCSAPLPAFQDLLDAPPISSKVVSIDDHDRLYKHEHTHSLQGDVDSLASGVYAAALNLARKYSFALMEAERYQGIIQIHSAYREESEEAIKIRLTWHEQSSFLTSRKNYFQTSVTMSAESDNELNLRFETLIAKTEAFDEFYRPSEASQACIDFLSSYEIFIREQFSDSEGLSRFGLLWEELGKPSETSELYKRIAQHRGVPIVDMKQEEVIAVFGEPPRVGEASRSRTEQKVWFYPLSDGQELRVTIENLRVTEVTQTSK